MRHILTTLLLLVTCSVMAQTQECTVPISVVIRDHPLVNDRMQDYTEHRFMNFLDRHGFTTVIKNARLTICLNPVFNNERGHGGDIRLDLVISITDMFTETVFYSAQLDTTYYGNAVQPMMMEMADDFASSLPELNEIAAAIRANATRLFEANTKNMVKTAKYYANSNQHKMAFYAMAQYPTCCPSIEVINGCFVSIYRDYLKKNHDALLREAKRAWKNQTSEVDARFVVSLLNSETLTEDEQKSAAKLLDKVAKKYPSLDLKAQEDYGFVPELKALAIQHARQIGIDYSSYDLPETINFIPLI